MAKIYWAGQSCFQLEVSNSRDHSANIVIDPLKEEKADILLLTSSDNKIRYSTPLKKSNSISVGKSIRPYSIYPSDHFGLLFTLTVRNS